MTDSPHAPRHDSIAPAASVGKNEAAAANRNMADWTVEEPVSESAPLARLKAAELCRSGYVEQHDCKWYHGIWQYLRIFGVAASPARNAGFFLDAFEAMARTGEYPRVLISGTADYSMLAHLLQAYRTAHGMINATVVDGCETPLFLCRWYAERMSETIDTCVSDMLDFAASEPFDAVCCHSFLSQFSLSQRTQLIAVWRRALRPGGKVITNTRINPSAPDDATGFSPDQVMAFRDRVYQEAVRRSDTLGIDPDEIADEAKKYAERLKLYCCKTEHEVIALFEDGGFDIERLDLIELGGKFAAGKTGPGTAQTAIYAEIVAVRR